MIPLGSGGAGGALVFLLGLRHGLDPDHVAVIDNLTFHAAEERAATAPWTGALFAAGHSASVAAVAVLVAVVTPHLPWPAWLGEAVDLVVILLLLLVGALNVRALRRPGRYRPAGWRSALLPRGVRGGDPLAVLATGAVFGLVFDTATQAAAWGAAASARAGIAGALAVSALFAAGMILTDTVDSQVVTALLRRGGAQAGAARYRRAVGWLIVTMSFGMAGYALASKLGWMRDLSDVSFTLVGAVMAGVVVAALLTESRRRRRPGQKAA